MITVLLLLINVISLIAIPLMSDGETEIYKYEIEMRRKYLSMRFNSYIRVDGDPTEDDITVTWLRNITESVDMEVLYIVQTPDGNETVSQSFDLPTLCTEFHLSNNWDRNIINIYLRSVTGNTDCPIQSGTINPPYSFNVHVILNHKLLWKTLHFIMDLYPLDELDSVATLVLEGHIHLL